MSSRPRRGLAVWLTASQTPLFVLDSRRVIVVFNVGSENLTQWTAAEVIGKACTFQAEPSPERIASLTGALCPPRELQLGKSLRRRTLFHRKDGSIIERDVHYFLLEANREEPAHVLGLITECEEAFPSSVHPHLEIARHTAALYAKYGLDRLIAASPAMKRVAAQIDLARGQSASVHIIGEKGSGREHIARLIHYTGNTRTQRFVPLRCGTASHFELDRALHRLAESGPASDIGTVYLEEITQLPGDLQALVLEQCEKHSRRWISSSPTGLEGLPDEVFQPKLVTLLTSLTMRIPPLRERGEDLPLLAQQLLEECNSTQGVQRTEFSVAVMRLFQKYSWPGNVKELSSVIAKACERSQSAVIETGDLPLQFTAALESRSVRPPGPTVSLDDQLFEFEKKLVLAALQSSKGNKSLAADRLGIPRAKLYRRLEQLGLLDVPESEEL